MICDACLNANVGIDEFRQPMHYSWKCACDCHKGDD